MGDYGTLKEKNLFKRLKVLLFWDGISLYEICLFYISLENKEQRLEHKTISNEEDALFVFETWCQQIQDSSFWDYKNPL